MQVSVEKTSSLGRRVTVSVPQAKVESVKNSKLGSISKNINLPGFRPGKVPSKVIMQRFNKEVKQEIINELMSATLPEALEQEKLTPIQEPAIETIDDTLQSDFVYTVAFEVFPEIDLIDFKSLELEKPVVDINDEDVDKGIERLREQFGVYNPIFHRAAHKGDKLTIDFEGSLK